MQEIELKDLQISNQEEMIERRNKEIEEIKAQKIQELSLAKLQEPQTQSSITVSHPTDSTIQAQNKISNANELPPVVMSNAQGIESKNIRLSMQNDQFFNDNGIKNQHIIDPSIPLTTNSSETIQPIEPKDITDIENDIQESKHKLEINFFGKKREIRFNHQSDYKTNPSKLKPNSNLFSRALSWCGRHPFAAAGIATSVILMGVGVGLCFTGIGSVPGAALTALGFKGLAASVSGTTLAVVGGNIATGAAIGIAGSVLGKAAQLVSEGISEVGKTVRNQFNKKKDETPPNLIPGIVISNKEVTYFKAKNCLNNSSKDLNKKPETGQKKLKNDNPDLCSDTVYSSNFKFFNSTKPNDSHKPSDNNSDYTVIPAARRRGGGG